MSIESMADLSSLGNSGHIDQSLARILNLSTLKNPPLRNWRTGDCADDQRQANRLQACFGLLALTLCAIIAVCIFLW